MNDDLIARLRSWIDSEECNEAADALESQAKRIAELETAVSAAPTLMAEPTTSTAELLTLVETLETRYGLSFLGAEKCLCHFARDWVFLTTPEPSPQPAPKPLSLDVIRQAIEERDAMEQKYHELAEHMVYHGNSVSWWHSKATAYRNAIDAVWAALRAAGIKADSIKTSADGVSELAALAQPAPKPLSDEQIDAIGLEALALVTGTREQHRYIARAVLAAAQGEQK
jgi:hypothetical protein